MGVQRIYDEMAGLSLREPIFEEPYGDSVRLTLENDIASRMLGREDALSSNVGRATFETLSEYERT